MAMGQNLDSTILTSDLYKGFWGQKNYYRSLVKMVG